MAEIEILHYHPGSSPLHRLDPRLKILLMLLYITVILTGSAASRACTTLLLLIGSRTAGLHPLAFRRELRIFGLLAGVIIISRFVGAIPAALSGAAAPEAAALEAGAAAWKFILIVWLGILFTAVMDPVEFHSVVHWLLHPVPGIPAGRLAAQTSFTLVLLPRLLDAAHEIREARRARGIENRKNPLRRLRTLVYPLFEKLLTDMEEFSLALEARCYNENVVRVRFRLNRADLLWWGFLMLPGAVMLLLPVFL
ncbi:MAG: energy-coupling factor transporter transmembrane component T family protein [Sediminispirochaetaceae bacterium]